MVRLKKLNKRGDISSPIIVILVTVAALAVAGMAVAWMASTGARAQSQGSIVILGTPTATPTTNPILYITVKNLGTATVNITQARLGTLTPVTVNQTVAPGASLALNISFSGTILSGTINGVLFTDAGTVPFSALVQ